MKENIDNLKKIAELIDLHLIDTETSKKKEAKRLYSFTYQIWNRIHSLLELDKEGEEISKPEDLINTKNNIINSKTLELLNGLFLLLFNEPFFLKNNKDAISIYIQKILEIINKDDQSNPILSGLREKLNSNPTKNVISPTISSSTNEPIKHYNQKINDNIVNLAFEIVQKYKNNFIETISDIGGDLINYDNNFLESVKKTESTKTENINFDYLDIDLISAAKNLAQKDPSIVLDFLKKRIPMYHINAKLLVFIEILNNNPTNVKKILKDLLLHYKNEKYLMETEEEISEEISEQFSQNIKKFIEKTEKKMQGILDDSQSKEEIEDDEEEDILESMEKHLEESKTKKTLSKKEKYEKNKQAEKNHLSNCVEVLENILKRYDISSEKIKNPKLKQAKESYNKIEEYLNKIKEKFQENTTKTALTGSHQLIITLSSKTEKGKEEEEKESKKLKLN